MTGFWILSNQNLSRWGRGEKGGKMGKGRGQDREKEEAGDTPVPVWVTVNVCRSNKGALQP